MDDNELQKRIAARMEQDIQDSLNQSMFGGVTTSATASEPMTMEKMLEAFDKIKMPPASEIPKRFTMYNGSYAREDLRYWENVLERLGFVMQTETRGGLFPSLSGIPIWLDHKLPPNEMRLEMQDGTTIKFHLPDDIVNGS